ncbi:MAG: MBL fold metallo-hydrolase [Candidatus Acidiferrales bacterium]
MKRLAGLSSLPFFALSIWFALFAPFSAKAATPDYSIQAIRYASAEDDVAGLVMGAPKNEKIEIAMVIWLIRGGGHNILFDSGYHRDTFLKYFPSTDYIRSDEAVKLAGLQPDEITDIVISHAHWITSAASIFSQRPKCGFRRRNIATIPAMPGSPAAITVALIRKTSSSS